MTSLESILPLLKLLPALVLEQSTYVCLYAKYHFIRANPYRSIIALARRNLQTRFPGVLGPCCPRWRVHPVQKLQ